jgi:5,10-methylenetetrahydromethanopterin reductase
VAGIGINFLDGPEPCEQLRLAQRADREGWDSIWVAETRTVRDAISILGAMACGTSRVKLGSGIVNTWTRGPVLMGMTFATLDEMAPGRTILGLGAYWDPLAWKQGVERTRPVHQMREYVHVVQRLLAMETVTFEGEIVKVRDIELQLGKGTARLPKHVPIYIGATGLEMVALTGEIADGILLNAWTSVSYQANALERLEAGAKKAGRTLDDLGVAQIVTVFLSEDGLSAMNEARYMVTMYLGQQPHIGMASGIDPELIDEIREAVGGWPPREGGIQRAVALVPDDVVNQLCAAGTAEQCRRRVAAYVRDGVVPVVNPITPNYDEIMDAFNPLEAPL